MDKGRVFQRVDGGMDCVRLKRGLCRLDLKPCKENCPLRKTEEGVEQHKKETMV